MNTFTYSTANMPAKDALAISSLLSLFERRLSAKWVMRNYPPTQKIDVLVVDVDRPGGPEALGEPRDTRVRVAVSEEDRAAVRWLITRPIRAYGNNGVIVLFNSVADLLEGRPEPAEPPRVPQAHPVPSAPETPRSQPIAAPPPPPPPIPASLPVSAAPEPNGRTAPRPPDRKFTPPEPIVLPSLVNMRTAPREVPSTPPPAPRVATPPPPPKVEAKVERPNGVARSPLPARNKWHAPDPIVLPELIDMRTGRPVGLRPPSLAPVPAAPKILVPEPPPAPVAAEPATPVPEPPPEPVIAAAEPVTPLPPALEPDSVDSAPVEPPAAAAAVLENPIPVRDPAPEDSTADWWGAPPSAPDPALDPEPAPAVPSGDCDLATLLKEIRRSQVTGIIEMGGLPAICVVPGRRAFFTSAPPARLEAAIAAHTRAAFRACASDEEARRLSGTEEFRPANLDQLYWSAALLLAAPLPAAFAEGPLRLKGWPPVSSASASGRYLRYATLLSGGAVTAQQLAAITGSDPREVTLFLQACHELGLLERGDAPRRAVAPPNAGAGTGAAKASILRSMLAQLGPKL